MEKLMIEVTDIRGTDNPDIIEIDIKGAGTARIRRDQGEVYPGRIYVPAWLGLRLLGIKTEQKGG